MGIFRVHFNNGYTSDHQQFKEPDKDAIVFIVAFQSIPKKATNQLRQSLKTRFS